MHAVFIAYGNRLVTEMLFRDMESQKFSLRHWKDGEKDMEIIVNGQLRSLPFGLWEYIFPKEAMPIVLTTLSFHQPDKSRILKGINRLPIAMFKKSLRIEDIPDFDTSQKFYWFTQNVQIIPVGIRHDVSDYTNPEDSEYPGWTHEAL